MDFSNCSKKRACANRFDYYMSIVSYHRFKILKLIVGWIEKTSNVLLCKEACVDFGTTFTQKQRLPGVSLPFSVKATL